MKQSIDWLMAGLEQARAKYDADVRKLVAAFQGVEPTQPDKTARARRKLTSGQRKAISRRMRAYWRGKKQ